MINLMPPLMKRELRAARANTVLRKYLTTSLVALVSLLVIFGGAYSINHMNYKQHKAQLEDSQQRLASLQDIRHKVKVYNESLTDAKQMFSNEIKLSKLVARISGALPPGSVMSNMSLDLEQLSKPLAITIQLDTIEKAPVLKRNFEDSGLFTQVILKDVSGAQGISTAYPYTASIEVALKPNVAKDANEPGGAP